MKASESVKPVTPEKPVAPIKPVKPVSAWRRELNASGLVYGLGFLVVAAATWFTFQFIEPAPPRQLSIATGNADGAYQEFGRQLQAQLAEHDVTLEVVETDGSVDNLQRLKDGQVDIAFIQSGLADPADYPNLESLGALYYEPLWVFSRAAFPLEQLSDLEGKRVASGGAGSGSRAVLERLLEDNGLTEADVDLSPLAGLQAAEALRAGEVDALVSVASIKAPMIESLLADADIALVSIARAPAYARREPWLTHLTLPEGVLDLARNIPEQSVDLLAVNATLVADEELHPALRDLLLLAADAVFSGPTLLSSARQFPSAMGSDFTISEQAQRYHENGPPFLQRYLPFWIANLVDRLKLLALPLLALLIPLSRMLPPAYRWTVRRKIYRWYDQVQALDQSASENQDTDHLHYCLNELSNIQSEVRTVEVPLSYAHELYGLRLHIQLLMQQIETHLSGDGQSV